MIPPTPDAIDPFRHFNPSLWTASKTAHISLFSIGSLFIVPAVYGLFVISMLMFGGLGFGRPSFDAEDILAIFSVVATCCTGTLAWSALGFLFFKRADARWQRVCWNISSTYGWIALLSSIGWLIFALSKIGPNDTGWEITIPFGILFMVIASAIACVVLGPRYAKAAKEFLNRPVENRDRPPQLQVPTSSLNE